jgi:hypothetical protein
MLKHFEIVEKGLHSTKTLPLTCTEEDWARLKVNIASGSVIMGT